MAKQEVLIVAKQVYQLAVSEAKTYPIWTNKQLTIPWWAGSAHDSREIMVSWNYEKTKIVSATLRVVAHCNGNTWLRVSMNGNSVVLLYWSLLEDWAEKIVYEDVTPLLLNGSNLFEADFWKVLHPFDASTLFTITLVLKYEDEEPSVHEKTWIEKYWMYAVGGVAAVTVGSIVWAKVK